jgi:TolA-binding protein
MMLNWRDRDRADVEMIASGITSNSGRVNVAELGQARAELVRRNHEYAKAQERSRREYEDDRAATRRDFEEQLMQRQMEHASKLAEEQLNTASGRGKSREMGSVNAGEKMHRRAGVKMHHGWMGRAVAGCAALIQAASRRTQLSSSINEPAFPSRPGITLATVRSVGDGRSRATRSIASMASTGPSAQ